MIHEIFWITVIYGFSMMSVHIAHRRTKHKKQQDPPTHYVLISHHNQMQIEWYIRSLLFLSWVKGKMLHITVIDRGSTDETLDIIRKLSLQRRIDIHIIQEVEDIGAYISQLPLQNINVIHINHLNSIDYIRSS